MTSALEDTFTEAPSSRFPRMQVPLWCSLALSTFRSSGSPMGGRHGVGRTRWFLGMAALAAAAGCGGSGMGGGSDGGGQAGYVVALDIRGSAAAFAGRVIVVNGQMEDGNMAMGTASATLLSIGLCTTNRDKFLTAPLHIQVYDSGTLLTDSVVNRVACALSANPGYVEADTIILQDDGTLLKDFGQDPGTLASCWPPGSPMICRMGETL